MQDILITPGSGEPQILFRGSGVNDTAVELNVLSSYQSATGSGTALLFEGEQGQLFAITDNLSSGVIFSVADITGLPAIEYNASGELKLGEYASNATFFKSVDFTGGTVTTSSPLIDGTQTWNDGAVAFTALKLNVTDTASSSSSLLMDLQVSGSSKFYVGKSGTLSCQGITTFATTGRLGTSSPTGSGNKTAEWGANYFGIIGGEFRIWSQSLSDPVILARDSGNILAQRNFTNPQTFRIYNTYTDASNYERASLKWDSNLFKIGTESLGTGTARDVELIVGGTTYAKINSGGKSVLGGSDIPADCAHRIIGNVTPHGGVLEIRNTNNNVGSVRIGQMPDSSGLYLTSNIYAAAESVHDYSSRWGMKIIGTNAATGTNTNLKFLAKPSGTSTYEESIEIDWTTTAGETRLLLYDVDTGTLQRVSVGAADSGGTGYKVLRIPN
jgi:hypothetical protein